MCLGGSPPKDNSGAIAAQQEAQRTANIKQDVDLVNKAFDGSMTGINPAAAYQAGTKYYNPDGTAWAAPTQDDYTKAFPAPTPIAAENPFQPGSKDYREWQPPAPTTPASTAPAFNDWQQQQINNAVSGGKLFTGTQQTGGFGQDYYDKITKDYENYYNPQLTTQYQNALNSLTYQLGQQGILQSTEGARQLGLLKQANQTNQDTIANNALNAAASAKQNISNQKNALLAQANTAADPSTLATQAAGVVSSQPPAFNQSVLGNVFSGILGQGTNALSIQQGGTPVTGQAGGGTFYQNYVSPTAGGGGGSSSGGGSSYVSN